MALTLGTGPLSPATDGVLSPPTADTAGVFVQPYPRRIRAVIGDRIVLDSEAGMMLHQPGSTPTVWVPSRDIADEALPEAGSLQRRPSTEPLAGELANFVHLQFDAADRWFVEDDPVYAHFKDPYHRVDVVSATRHVVVKHRGAVVAETQQPKLLFETSVPVRYYLPWKDVLLEMFTLSATISECPYKGDGQHWHLDGAGDRVEDAAWSLPHPLPEGLPAIEHVSFYPHKVQITVDGREITG